MPGWLEEAFRLEEVGGVFRWSGLEETFRLEEVGGVLGWSGLEERHYVQKKRVNFLPGSLLVF